jgi:glycolate oxidase FAD binding subunit
MRTLEALQAQVKSAFSTDTPLAISAGRTKSLVNRVIQGEVCDVSGYQGIVSYEPTELVITARCGTLLSQLEAALAERKQYLPFEPPHFGATATVGGMIAAGYAGSARASAGGVRDYVLGAQMIDGKGDALSFGGQVIKNVAGYDISRLLAGSMGSLGIITEVSLKVLPLPPAELSLAFEMNEADAIHALNTWGGKPLPINASCWHDGLLSVRLRGALTALEAAQRSMGGKRVPQAEAQMFWQSLREQTHTFFTLTQDEALWRLSVPSVCKPFELGATLIEWGGAQRWVKAHVSKKNDEDAAKNILSITEKASGHAAVFRGEGVRHASKLSAPLLKIHHGLKQAFDPKNLFNRGLLLGRQ